MNLDRFKTNWKQFKGKLKTQWGKLTGNSRTAIAGKYEQLAGKREELAGKLQRKYAGDKAESEKQLDEFKQSLDLKETIPPV